MQLRIIACGAVIKKHTETQKNTEIVPWLNHWNTLKYFKYLYSTRLVGWGEVPLLWETENVACVQAQYRDFFPLWFVIFKVPLFLPSLPMVRIHDHYGFSHDTITDAVISQRLVLFIHPSIRIRRRKTKGGKVLLPKCSNFKANHPKSAYRKCWLTECSVWKREKSHR